MVRESSGGDGDADKLAGCFEGWEGGNSPKDGDWLRKCEGALEKKERHCHKVSRRAKMLC